VSVCVGVNRVYVQLHQYSWIWYCIRTISTSKSTWPTPIIRNNADVRSTWTLLLSADLSHIYACPVKLIGEKHGFVQCNVVGAGFFQCHEAPRPSYPLPFHASRDHDNMWSGTHTFIVPILLALLVASYSLNLVYLTTSDQKRNGIHFDRSVASRQDKRWHQILIGSMQTRKETPYYFDRWYANKNEMVSITSISEGKIRLRSWTTFV
jgi:hypothetical protein